MYSQHGTEKVFFHYLAIGVDTERCESLLGILGGYPIGLKDLKVIFREYVRPGNMGV